MSFGAHMYARVHPQIRARWHTPPPRVKGQNRYRSVMSNRNAVRYQIVIIENLFEQADTPCRYQIVIKFLGSSGTNFRTKPPCDHDRGVPRDYRAPKRVGLPAPILNVGEH